MENQLLNTKNLINLYFSKTHYKGQRRNIGRSVVNTLELAPMQKERMNSRIKYISILIILMASLTLYSQDLKPLLEIEIVDKKDKHIKLVNNDLLTIKTDKNFFNHIITIKRDGVEKLTDSVEITPYGFNFRFFELKNEKGFLLITEVEYEYISEYPIYFVGINKIKKIGNLNIRLDCNDCDALNYPLNDIIVKGNEDKIEFTFEQNLVLIDNKNFQKFKKGDIRFVYECKKEKLIIKKNNQKRLKDFNLIQDFDENKQRFNSDTFDLMDFSTEGGVLTVFHTNEKEYLVFDIWLYGEMGKLNTTYWTDKNFEFKIIRENRFDYDRPMYEPDFRTTETVQYFVYSDSDFVIYNQSKNEIQDSLYLDKRKELKEFFTIVTKNIEIVK